MLPCATTSDRDERIAVGQASLSLPLHPSLAGHGSFTASSLSPWDLNFPAKTDFRNTNLSGDAFYDPFQPGGFLCDVAEALDSARNSTGASENDAVAPLVKLEPNSDTTSPTPSVYNATFNVSPNKSTLISPPAATSHVDEDVMFATDPLSSKIAVPKKFIRQTLATLRPGVPSICLLYLDGHCRKGPSCHQLHADPAEIRRLRAEAQKLPTCCARHGDIHSQGAAISAVTSIDVSGQVIPIDSFANTIALNRLLKEATVGTEMLTAPPTLICRLHRDNNCRYKNDCRFLHICRDVMQGAFAEVSDLVPELIERHATGKTSANNGDRPAVSRVGRVPRTGSNQESGRAGVDNHSKNTLPPPFHVQPYMMMPTTASSGGAVMGPMFIMPQMWNGQMMGMPPGAAFMTPQQSMVSGSAQQQAYAPVMMVPVMIPFQQGPPTQRQQ